MKVLVNAVAAKMGGAGTYLENFFRVAETRTADTFTVFVAPGQAAKTWRNIHIVPAPTLARGQGGRFLFDLVGMPILAEEGDFDAILSTGNFATLSSPCRQVLLIRNSIYFARQYLQRIERNRPSVLIDHELKRAWIQASVRVADRVVFPTQAMQEMVADFIDLPQDRCRVIPHGFDAALFVQNARLASERFRGLRERPGPKILMVSHWALHKDFGTLFAGFERFRRDFPKALLVVTADLERRRSEILPEEWEAFCSLRAAGAVEDLGAVSYREVPALYASCDMFAFTSLTESFCHPLVEAMCIGVPIVASSISCHREICGPRALYFTPGDAQSLAEGLAGVAAMGARDRERIQTEGARRAAEFSWTTHVDALLRELKG